MDQSRQSPSTFGMTEAAQTTALQFRVLAQSKLLEISWEDGATSRHSFSSLRAACRCAVCHRARNLKVSATDDDKVLLQEITPVGRYAVQFSFSDGHCRGIYPFSYLRELAYQE
jgi:DUF971 family protein